MDDLLSINATELATDPDSNPITFSIVSDVTNGVLSVDASGPLNYLPKPGFFGVDSFSYKVSDGKLQSPSKTVMIDVKKPIPNAWGGTYYTHRDVGLSSTPYSLLRYASDGYSSGELSLTASPYGTPSHGSLTIAPDGTFQFAPESGFDGSASFEFRVFNGYEYSSPVRNVVQVGTQAIDDYFYSVNNQNLTQTVANNDSSPISRFNVYSPSISQDWVGYSFEMLQGQHTLVGRSY